MINAIILLLLLFILFALHTDPWLPSSDSRLLSFSYFFLGSLFSDCFPTASSPSHSGSPASTSLRTSPEPCSVAPPSPPRATPTCLLHLLSRWHLGPVGRDCSPSSPNHFLLLQFSAVLYDRAAHIHPGQSPHHSRLFPLPRPPRPRDQLNPSCVISSMPLPTCPSPRPPR